MVVEFIRGISGADRTSKRSILIAYDVAAMFLALWGAFSARLGEVYVPDSPLIPALAACSVVLGIVGLFQLRVYHLVLRFFDLGTVSRIFFGAAIAATGWAMLVYSSRATMFYEG